MSKIPPNLYQRFPRQLTKWTDKYKLAGVVASFEKYDEGYGKGFIIKSNRKKVRPKFAVFIRKENKLRRYGDVQLINYMSVADLLMMILPNKQEGVPLLKTLSNSL